MKKGLIFLSILTVVSLITFSGCSTTPSVGDPVKSYIVTFNSQGADVEANPASKTVTLPATTVDILPAPPVKAGYIFGGWYTATNGGGTEFTTGTIVDANITVYAKWLAVYTVTFDSQSADIEANPNSITIVSPATTIDVLPVEPIKTGYNFAGWYTATNGGGTEFFASTVILADITVYAKWSPAGSVWATQTLPSSADWRSVTYGNGVFVTVAYSGASAATSPDGITWTARTLPISADWISVAYGNGIFVAIAYNSTNVATSTDGGTNWTLHALPASAYWQSIAFGNGIFIAVAGSGTIAATSPDGIAWTARTLPSSANWSSVAFGNGVFTAVAYGGTAAATSTNGGKTWTSRILPSSANWVSVTYGNGIFVAVSYGSASAATSSDGINWTARTLPSSTGWISVTYGNGVFVAVARTGTIAATSP